MSAPANNSITDLVVENEMLTNEVRRLRSHVAKLEKQLSQTQAPAARPAPARAERSPQRILERQALEDIRYLIARAQAKHLAPVLRLRKGYRNLEMRYSVPDPAQSRNA